VILGLLVIVLSRLSIWKSEIQREKPLPDPHSKIIPAILAAILVCSFALRLYGLDYGLWYDEILTYVKYMKMPFGEIITTYDDQNQHFLYTLLAHTSFLIFGEGAWSIRLPAVIFGVGSIWALYFLGHQVSSKREALLAAAILTFSYHHIWFSQNARGYTGLLFWTILASWFFVRTLREVRPQLWLMYAVTAALGIYTHMTMIFVVIGHFIIYLIMIFSRDKESLPERWVGFFLGFCLAGFLTLQLYAFVLPQIFGGMLWQGAESTVQDWKNPVWTLLELAKGMKISYGGSIVAIAAFLVFGAGLLSFTRKNPLVIQLLIIPALVGTTVVIGMGHPLWPRFFFFTLGFSVLVVVRGIMLLGHVTSRLLNLAFIKSDHVGTALCIGLIVVSTMSIPYVYAPKQDYLGALVFVDENKELDDAIVTVGAATFPYKRCYKTEWEEAETLEALNSIRSRAKRTWLLYTIPLHLQSEYPEIMASIQRDFKVVKQFYGTLGDGIIYVCRADSPHL